MKGRKKGSNEGSRGSKEQLHECGHQFIQGKPLKRDQEGTGFQLLIL